MASVAFEGVEKRYPGGVVALAPLDLAVGDGELLAVVGPSGCGKSTLLRLLAGLEAPSAGVLRIGERIVNELGPRERNVAMVFQDYALYPHMTVRGNLEFPLRMRRMARVERRRRVDAVAGRLDLAALLDRLPRQLSGGQRQRVAMGRALVREPSVFLLDEPLSNLDARLRVSVRAEVGELQRRSATTMLYVTHDQVEAMTLGQRVAVLNAGVLEQLAAPHILYEEPVSAFVAGFIGSPPMQLFPTRVLRDGAGGLAVAIGAQQLGLPADHPAARALGAAKPSEPLRGGVRPEALCVARLGDATAIEARVAHAESLGHETLVHVLVAAAAGEPIELVARLPGPPSVVAGAPIRLSVQSGGLHLFDADGRALRAA